ncbi:chaperonin 10-like protein [Aspergillus pseudodeflectus]|uniref:Chaperonin 10-like protein n=1 Tax=Aspergillus pseudodeflectus TaxID=176178 RepID=A0ABR4JIJ4_9EURO
MATATTERTGHRPTVTALRFHKRGDIRLEQLQLPPCGPDEVCVKVAYCGICGTDTTEYLAGPIFPPQEGCVNPHTGVSLPVVMGHEYSGTIAAVGSHVHDLQVGQSVVISPAYNHHSRHYGSNSEEFCEPCRSGRYNICDASATIGLNAPGGGLSERTVVRAVNCIPLPASVSLRAAALVEPLAIGRHSLVASGFKPGQSALIAGAGPIGLAILLLLRVMGASRVIVTEIQEPRLAQARRFGADIAINPLDHSSRENGGGVEDAVRQVAKDGGVDVAFDAIGLQSTLDLCIQCTKPGGVIFNVAIHKTALALKLNDLGMKEKRLMGGISYMREDFEYVIALLAEGKLDSEQMVTSVVPLSRAVEDAFEELIHRGGVHMKILVQP